jgi:hypothetical protein
MMVRAGNSALIWVAGNAPGVSTKGDYYQGKKSIPKPLQLIRQTGRGSLELIAHEALALTKMDWNNDALYNPVPVSKIVESHDDLQFTVYMGYVL